MAQSEMNLDQFSSMIGGMAAIAQDINYAPVLREVSDLIAEDMEKGFVASRDPDGKPWRSLKRKDRKRTGQVRGTTRIGSGKPLVASGLLMAAASAKGTTSVAQGAIRDVKRHSLEFGVDGKAIPYAISHQEPVKDPLMKREFIGVGDSLLVKIEDKIEDHLASKLPEVLLGGFF